MRLKLIAAAVIASLASISFGSAHAQTPGDMIAGQHSVLGMTTNANGEVYLLLKKQGEKPVLCVLNKPNILREAATTVTTQKCFQVQ